MVQLLFKMLNIGKNVEITKYGVDITLQVFSNFHTHAQFTVEKNYIKCCFYRQNYQIQYIIKKNVKGIHIYLKKNIYLQ